MQKDARIYIAGHTGLIGSALVRKYTKEGFSTILTRTKQELDLRIQKDVDTFFHTEEPEYVILAAAQVGGIKANMEHPAAFLIENLQIQSNVILASQKYNVKKLLYISCGCAYPTQSKQPIKEEYLLTGQLEKTNEGFAIAKIAGMKMCEMINIEYNMHFISCVAANTYGENDHFDENRSHVISALMKKFHEAKKNNRPSITIWGTGTAKREFIYVDDLANGIFLLMNSYVDSNPINLGSGEEISIKELSRIIQKVVGYPGEIVFDSNKPDGMKRRVFDSSKIKKLGFKTTISLEEGITKAYQFYLRHAATL